MSLSHITIPPILKRLFFQVMLPVLVLSGIRYGFRLMDADQLHVLISLAGFLQLFIVLIFIVIQLIKARKLIVSNILVVILLMLVLEFACWLLLGMPTKQELNITVPNLPPDHITSHLGYLPYCDTIRHDIKTTGTDTIFDVHYSIDDHCRRITPGHHDRVTKYALFFGCSAPFGHGLNDDQTLPYLFQINSGYYNAYNYANSGWGTQQMLALFEYKNLSDEVKEKDGIGVYVFTWQHPRRVIGDMHTYVAWAASFPYYYLRNGELHRDGNFKNGRWFVSKMYELLYPLSIVQYFKISLPIHLSDGDLELVAEIIAESRRKYIEQFGNDKFYVLIHPNRWKRFQVNIRDRFLHLLQEKKIQYFDHSDTFVLDDDHVIIGDGHPNAKTYEKVSWLLIHDIQK